MLPQLEILRKQAFEEYPSKYEQVIGEWQQSGRDALWLLYSANYLFRAGEVRWAIDPLTLYDRLSAPHPHDPLPDFAKLDFIILTHAHHDHIDWNFLKSIAALPIPWIVPDFLVQTCRDQTGLPPERIIPAITGQWIEIKGIQILPMQGFHWEYGPVSTPQDGICPDAIQPSAIPGMTPVKGLPCAAYLIEFNHKRWYCPGDVRTYDLSQIPDPGRLDGVIAHVWLGRLPEAQSEPPLLTSFCDYFSSFDANRLLLTHLYELGREPKDMWTLEHARKIIAAFASQSPSPLATAHCTGDRVDL